LLVEKIEHEGKLATWVYSNRRSAGLYWNEDIDRAIRECTALIVVMTPDARASEHIAYEWAFALALRKPVVLILYKDTDLPPRLAGIPSIDFRVTQPWDRLIDDLQEAIMSDLANTLRDEDGEVGRSAAWTLAGMGSERSLQTFLSALDDPGENVRLHAAATLGEIGDTFTVPALITALGDISPKVREAAAGSLGRIGEAGAVMGLIEALRDADRGVRLSAAWSLGAIGDDRAAQGLLDILHDPDRDVRLNAAWALGAISDAPGDVLPGLVEVLQDEDAELRGSAAEALGKIGHMDAVPALIEGLSDNGELVLIARAGTRVCDMVADALERIGTPKALAAVEAWRGGEGGTGG
jgi:HEAT repeat protein